MSLLSIYNRLHATPFFAEVRSWVEQLSGPSSVYLKGLTGSLPAFLVRDLLSCHSGLVVCLFVDEDQAAYFQSDLEQVWGSEGIDHILRFPASGRKPYDPERISDITFAIQRIDALHRLSSGFAGVLISSIDAVCETVVCTTALHDITEVISIGMALEPGILIKRLVDQQFMHVSFVESPGEIALRGGIVDVFPFSNSYPIRIEFFGDEIESIREFDPLSQRSISRRTTARLTPNLDVTFNSDDRATFFSYLTRDVPLLLFDKPALVSHANQLFESAQKAFQSLEVWGDVEDVSRETPGFPLDPDTMFLDGAALDQAWKDRPQLLVGGFSDAEVLLKLSIDALSQPAFNASVKLLRSQLHENKAAGVETIILCDSIGQESRLAELLQLEEEAELCTLQVDSLHEGFYVPEMKLAVYTDHQIFNRYHRPTARKRVRRTAGMTLQVLRNLNIGDYVVHIDYGIGRFDGMERVTVRGQQQEVVRVLYQGNDLLYVNVNALYKLHKYTGKEGHQPRVTKLGSGQWERKKSKAKKRVKDIARELIQLYARRKGSIGFSFSPDSVWQRELEASFQYEDTPDQAAAAETVKQDMEQSVPMDRLVCGDVGFGKTEVAVRAAFKAVQDGKQVAVLVPTTILADQHYETFQKRLEAYPVQVDMLSRFRSASQQRETLTKVVAGQVDVLIGTHRIVSKDVKFKDLGLLIVDEEQRFGVAVKEKLRHLKASVDTLTLTATPIPRTMQFSLLGARDLSVIHTPPPNRQPIVTEIHSFDKNLIQDAILYEINRGGQVFFLHNRVRTIEDISAMIRALVPNVRVQVAHGQMKPSLLERVMHNFIQHKFDVLVCTNIVENGLDVANANTIIIDHAERFGLSDLHQLRGRVGRSDQKAFCYLLTPSIHNLTREGRQRLQAVEEFSDLGQGFNIALRDLDIRGAGSLLGGEQSGFIEEIGYETYHKILDEAVQEIRTEEFSELFKDNPQPDPSTESVIDVEADALLPTYYVSDALVRLNLYRRLSECDSQEGLEEIRQELLDRFGPLPEDAEHLFMAAEIKLQAQLLRLPRIQFKNHRLFISFPSPEEDAKFFSHTFHPLLEQLNNLSHRFVLKEANSKLRAIIQNVQNLRVARDLIYQLRIPQPAP